MHSKDDPHSTLYQQTHELIAEYNIRRYFRHSRRVLPASLSFSVISTREISETAAAIIITCQSGPVAFTRNTIQREMLYFNIIIIYTRKSLLI